MPEETLIGYGGHSLCAALVEMLGRLRYCRCLADSCLRPVRMGQLLAAWATHDLNHLGQIVKTMAKQYREEIGPWRTFLAIVDAE